jgi:hypothetical protein
MNRIPLLPRVRRLGFRDALAPRVRVSGQAGVGVFLPFLPACPALFKNPGCLASAGRGRERLPQRPIARRGSASAGYLEWAALADSSFERDARSTPYDGERQASRIAGRSLRVGRAVLSVL